MNFYDWMLQRGLSASSALKYQKAVSGVLTDWAKEASIVSDSLDLLLDKTEFDAAAEKIRQLDIYNERNRRGNSMYNAALRQYSDFLGENLNKDIESDIETIVSDSSLNATEKARLIQTRMGQGLFRKKLIDYCKGCAITGFKDTRLLGHPTLSRGVNRTMTSGLTSLTGFF